MTRAFVLAPFVLVAACEGSVESQGDPQGVPRLENGTLAPMSADKELNPNTVHEPPMLGLHQTHGGGSGGARGLEELAAGRSLHGHTPARTMMEARREPWRTK